MISNEEFLFFTQSPEILPIYEAFKKKLQCAYPEMKVKISKTQISFSNRYMFAMASLPWKKRKGWPETYLLISFGLSYQKPSPRIAQSVEAYPNRWTHHVIVECEREIDEELLAWIDEAYQFSLIK